MDGTSGESNSSAFHFVVEPNEIVIESSDDEVEYDEPNEPQNVEHPVKEEEGNSDIIVLSSDEEAEVIQEGTSGTTSQEQESLSRVKTEVDEVTQESIRKLIDGMVIQNDVQSSYASRYHKIAVNFELVEKEVKNSREQYESIKEMSEKIKLRETHITGEGVINPDTTLSICEPVQRIITIDAITRKVTGSITGNDEEVQIELDPYDRVTYFPEIAVIETQSVADLKQKYKLPDTGPIIRAPLQVGDKVFAVTNPANMAKSTWQPATIIELLKVKGKMNYSVTYEDSFIPCMLLKISQIAYSQPPTVLLTIKCRVVAGVDVSLPGLPTRIQYYSGVVAEIPRRSNRFRYLIFFDSGAVGYTSCQDIFLIVEDSSAYLEDIPEENKPFLRKYFNDLPERALVKYSVGTKDLVWTEDKWIQGKVKEVDCSLVYFHYRSLSKYEWIYRGSPRLKPLDGLITSLANLTIKARAPRKKTTIFDQSRSRPFVQYLRDEGDLLDEDKRSPSKSSSTVKRLDPFAQTAQKPEFELEVELFEPPTRRATSRLFVPHRCDSDCINTDYENLKDYRDVNPFAIPVICGWERQIGFLSHCRRKKREIFYVGPCGRRMRTIKDVDLYLELTGSNLTIDLFTFHTQLSLYSDLDGKRTQGCYYYEPDVARGTENHSLSCINWINDNPITPGFEYWPSRFGGRGVDLDFDVNFLMCCDCTDNCRDKSKCDCQQITSEAYSLIRTLSIADEFEGYNHRRLGNAITTGIWECNSNCACNANCANRVVQHGIRVRLQIYQTEKKGWGIRCLHDIPPGAFICIYAAEVLSEEWADQVGSSCGDEYLADLDYIENVEQFKQDYEEAVQEVISSSSSDESNSPTSDQDSEPQRPQRRRNKSWKSKSATSKKQKKEKEREKEREKEKAREVLKKHNSGKPYRELFGESQAYSLDAKRRGNVGRYFNHSCDPNCYVQNVFIDSHDLRFPWVALFSCKFIPAFTELVWDYNYEIIEGRKLWCQCGAAICRGRLL